MDESNYYYVCTAFYSGYYVHARLIGEQRALRTYAYHLLPSFECLLTKKLIEYSYFFFIYKIHKYIICMHRMMVPPMVHKTSV